METQESNVIHETVVLKTREVMTEVKGSTDSPSYSSKTQLTHKKERRNAAEH